MSLVKAGVENRNRSYLAYRLILPKCVGFAERARSKDIFSIVTVLTCANHIAHLTLCIRLHASLMIQPGCKPSITAQHRYVLISRLPSTHVASAPRRCSNSKSTQPLRSHSSGESTCLRLSSSVTARHQVHLASPPQ